MNLAAYRAYERTRNRIRCAIESDRDRVVRQFEESHGYQPDLENPGTWSEKIQWMKLHDHDPLYTRCADKYRMREYVSEIAGDRYLVPLVGVYDDARNINFESLPERFIIKANHGCGWNLVRNGNSRHLDRQAVIKRCNKWLVKNYYVNHREWQYKNIPPLLMIERLLVDDVGEIPADYKIHCFDHGRGDVVVGVDRGRFKQHMRDHYDEHWTRVDLTFKFPQSENGSSRPEGLEGMVGLARQLAEPFRYVRVDLYSISGRIHVGELTLTPGSGYDRFVPQEIDADWGSRFEISSRRP